MVPSKTVGWADSGANAVLAMISGEAFMVGEQARERIRQKLDSRGMGLDHI